jgi:tetratricopeptide (TPR) repeat protein
MKNYIFPAVSFVLIFVLYLLSAAPGLMFTDSGELAAVCSTLGIAHPTGYPLFSIIGHLWTLLPLPFEDIYKLNIFAAIVTAASVPLFYSTTLLILKNINEKRPAESVPKRKSKKPEKTVKLLPDLPENISRIIALAAALTFGTAATIWQQGTSIEVYSLHILIMNITVYFAVKGSLTGNLKFFLTAAFFAGLGFTNHMTTLLILPGLFILFFRFYGEKFDFSSARFRNFLILVIPFFIALSVYIYMPLRSAQLPDMNWGWVHRGFDKFLYHVQGKQYQVWMFSGTEAIQENLGKFFGLLPYQFAAIGLVPVLLGIYRLFRTSPLFSLFLLTTAIVCVGYSVNYSIHDIDAYFSTAIFALLIFMAAGIYFIIEKIRANRLQLAWLFLLIPAANILLNFTENDESDNYLVPEYTRNVIDNLDSNAVIITAQWDYWNSAFLYQQIVESKRTDITMIGKELLRRTWYLPQLQQWYPEVMEPCSTEIDRYLEDLEEFESTGTTPMTIQAKFEELLDCFVRRNIDKRPVYITLEVFQEENRTFGKYNSIPQGFAIRLLEHNQPRIVSLDGLDLDKFLKSAEGRDDYLSRGIVEAASINITNIGRYAFAHGQRETAIEAFELALRVNPENSIAAQGLRQAGR